MEIQGSPDQNALRSRWTLLGVAALACVLIVAIAFGAPIQTVVGLLLITPILAGVVGAAVSASKVLLRHSVTGKRQASATTDENPR